MVKCEERYNKGKMVHSIMRHVAEKTSTPLETLYETIGWPLNRRYGHAIDAFKISIANPDDVWSGLNFPSEAVRTELLGYIGKRLTPAPTKVRADIEVTCFGYDGIDAIRAALKRAEETSSKDVAVRVKLVSPPLYVLTSQCIDKAQGIAKLDEAIRDVETAIGAYDGGRCAVKMAPKAVTENDDAELQALMARRERENAQVSGDEDSSLSDDDGVAAAAAAAA